jgi:hypothetical protein
MVELPSASELTTRCPIRLRMKLSDERSARVSVQWKKPPSNESGKELAFPVKIIAEDEWAKLPDAIAEAQRHIIDITGKEVASDVVEVEITGPQCEDLTVVDLPGIVRTTGKGESENLGEDIKELTDTYLKNSRCVILAVVPANVDFHNSQIMNEAAKVDPNTERTIPVITKPDLIDKGAEKDIVELLLGKKTIKFEYGFHMVKNRGQDALNQKATIEDGLKTEESYFENTEPWKHEKDRSLFGTPELRRKLGELQLSLIRSSLPQIIDEMEVKKENALSDLTFLGAQHPTVFHKRMFFFDLIKKLSCRLKGDLVGCEASDMIQDGMSSSAKFHENCSDFATKLKTGELSNICTVKKGTKVVSRKKDSEVKGVVLEENEDGLFIDDDDRIEVDNDSVSDPTKPTDRRVGETWWIGKQLAVATGLHSHATLKPFPRKNVRRDQEWLLDLINKNRPYELPIFPNTVVFNKLVSRFIQRDWRKPCTDLVQAMSALLCDASDNTIGFLKEAARYEKLSRFLKLRATKVLQDCIDLTHEEIDKFIQREMKPYTQDHYVFENLAKKSNEWLKKGIIVALGPPDQDKTMTTAAIHKIVKAEFVKNQEKSVDQHMAEQMEHALDAFGKVTLKRFIDVVPSICWENINKFPQRLENELMNTPDEDLLKIMADSSSFKCKFDELETEAKELQEGLVILQDAILS